jgi:hypothetical protein
MIGGRTVQRPQKRRLLAVPGIESDPFEPHSRARASRTIFSACSLFEVGVRAFCGISARSHRAGSSIQPFGRYSRMSTGACRWPSLSTANTATWQWSTLPSRPDPLPGHTHRTITLLGKAAFVDNQAAGRLAAQQGGRRPG